MHDALTLGKNIVFAPARAVERFRAKDGAMKPSLVLYAFFVITAVLFYALKPANFPPDEMGGWQGGAQQEGILFWTRVEAWGPLLTAVWAVFLAWFLAIFKRPSLRLPIAMALSVFSLAAMIVATALFFKHKLTGPYFGGFWLLVGAVMWPFLKERTPSAWKQLVAVLLALNTVNVALVPVFCLTVVARAADVYFALEVVMLLWTMGLAAYIIGSIENVSRSRAFFAVLFSVIPQILFVFSMYGLGLLPKDILKAMMTV